MFDRQIETKGVYMHYIVRMMLVVELVLSVSSMSSFHPYIDLLHEQELVRVLIDNRYRSSLADYLNQLGILSQPSYNSLRLKKDRPLFDAYTGLSLIPHVSLCQLPTPVQKLEIVSEYYNKQVYLKDDSRSAGTNEHGNAYYGGNKVRKLEFLLGEAQAYGARRIITFGCVGSNHAVATSIHAQRLGMKVTCLLTPQPMTKWVQEKLCYHAVISTDLLYAHSNQMRNVQAMACWLNEFNECGTFPYVIPTGGSNECGALGFVNAAFELKKQIEQGLLPEPDRIYVACGSGGTAVGLALGCKLAGLSSRIMSIVTEPIDEEEQFFRTLSQLASKTIYRMRCYDRSIPDISLDDCALEVRYEFGGAKYGAASQESMQAKHIMNNMQQIILDDTYTAKACAAMVHDLEYRSDSSCTYLFWNTFDDFNFEITNQANVKDTLPYILQQSFF